MAGIKISELPEASSVCGNELVAIVQNSCTKFVSASAIGSLGTGSITSITAGCGLAGGGCSGSINIGMDSNCYNAYNSTTTTLAAASGNWDSTYSTLEGLSGNWDQSACAGLNCVGDITGLCVGSGLAGGGVIGDVNVCIDAVCSTAWNGTTSIVATNSASWAGGGTTISGTACRVAKFSAGGADIEDSTITDLGAANGVTIGADTTVCGIAGASGLHLPSLSSTSIDPGVSGYVYQDGRNLKISNDVVTVSDTAGTSSTLASSCLFTDINSVTVGPASAAYVGSYYKPLVASADELTVAFYSDSDEIEVKIERSSSVIQTFIDDEPVHEFASGGYQNRLLKLSHADKKIRKYELRGKSYGYGGVYVKGTTDHSIWPYKTRRTRPLLAIMTDSYGTAFNDIYGRSFAEKLAEYLDMDLFSDAINSTGWSTTTITTLTRADSLNALTRTPDVILACLGFNDKSSPNQTNIENGINNWHAAVVAEYPSAAYMLASPWTPQGTEANLTTVSGYIQGRATALGADFININGVITASNESLYTSDDNTHPNQAGHDLLARRLQAAMLATGNIPSSN